MPADKVVPADDIEVLEGEVEETKPPKTEVGKDEEEEVVEEVLKSDEDEEEPEEEKEEEEGKEELELGPRRPSFKEVKSKYPDFFKDFPDLREAFFRESKYTEIFPTIEDAQEAREELASLSTIREKVLEGDFTAILEASKETDKTSYDKLVDNLLPHLYKSDQDAFMRAITPSIENMLRTAYRDGTGSGDEDLQNSALHISKWFFNTEEVATGKTTTLKKTPEISKEQDALSSERAEFEATKFRDAYNIVLQDRNSTMEEMILNGLDPDKEMSQYIKSKLTKDIIEEVDRVLQKDGAHMALMNAKWKRAKQEGYNRDSLRKIVTTYQARARSLVPSVRAKLKASALGRTDGKEKLQQVAHVAGRKEVPAGATSRSGTRLPSPKDIDWRSTSDADILAGNIRTRGK
jgi:hypothetical protein